MLYRHDLLDLYSIRTKCCKFFSVSNYSYHIKYYNHIVILKYFCFKYMNYENDFQNDLKLFADSIFYEILCDNSASNYSPNKVINNKFMFPVDQSKSLLMSSSTRFTLIQPCFTLLF